MASHPCSHRPGPALRPPPPAPRPLCTTSSIVLLSDVKHVVVVLAVPILYPKLPVQATLQVGIELDDCC